MHDDGVALVKMQPGGVFEHDLFVYRSFGVRKFHALALQRVVKHLGATKKARSSLNQMPVSFDAYRVHHQGERRQELRDAAAVKRRANMRDAHRANALGFPNYSFGRLGTD